MSNVIFKSLAATLAVSSSMLVNAGNSFFPSSSGSDVTWNLEVTNGYYNAGENWVGGAAPSGIGMESGDLAIIPTGNKYITIRFPAGGYYETHYTRVMSPALGEARTVTFDTRGTTWVQGFEGDEKAQFGSGWQPIQFSYMRSEKNEFLMQVARQNDSANKIFCLDDAVLRFSSDEYDRHSIYLDCGTFSGIDNLIHLYVGEANKTPVDFHVAGGAKLGNLSFKGYTRYFNQLRISSGSLNMHGSSAWFAGEANVIPGNKETSPATLVLDGDGATFAAAALVIAGQNNSQNAAVYVKDNSVMTLNNFASGGWNGHLEIAKGQNSKGILKASDDARVICRPTIAGATEANNHGYAIVGSGVDSTGVMELCDRSYFEVKYNLRISEKSNASGTLILSNDAQAVVGTYLRMGALNGDHAYACLSLSDSAKLTVPKIIGCNSETYLRADGGTISIPQTAVDATVGGFSSAVLGEKGLSVEANAALNLNQSFSGEGCLKFVGGAVEITADQNADVSIGRGATITVGENVHLKRVTVDAGGKLIVNENAGIEELCIDSNAAVVEIGENGCLTLGKLNVSAEGVIFRVAKGGTIRLASTNGIDHAVSLAVEGDFGEEGSCVVSLTSAGSETIAPSLFNVLNASTGMIYDLEISADGKSLVVKSQTLTSMNFKWNGGASGDWSNPSNWLANGEPATRKPTVSDSVTIDEGAEAMVINVLGGDGAGAIVVNAGVGGVTNSVTLRCVEGAGALPFYLNDVNGVTVNAGKLVIDTPVSVGQSLVADVSNDDRACVEFSRSISSSGKLTLTKKGLGALVISGDNSALDVDWVIPGGINTFAGANSFGIDTLSESGLVLSNNTLRYVAKEGESSGAVIKRNPYFIGKYPVHFNIEGDLTFRDYKVLGPNDNAIWAYVKTGIGNLTFEMPDDGEERKVDQILRYTYKGQTENDFYDGNAEGDFPDIRRERKYISNMNESQSSMGMFVPSENGMVNNWVGLTHLSIIEGTMCIRGARAADLNVKPTKPAVEVFGVMVGGGGFPTRKDAELRIENLPISFSGENNQANVVIGKGNVPGGCIHPRLTLVNSYMLENSIGILTSNDHKTNAYPIVTMTNSVMSSFSGGKFGNKDDQKTYGDIATINMYDSTILVNKLKLGNTNLNLEKGSAIRLLSNPTTNPVSDTILAIGLYDENYDELGPREGKEKIMISGGSELDIWYFNMHWWTTRTSCNYLFDGGILNLTYNGLFSATANPSQQGFIVGEGGMYVKVTNNLAHTMTIPFSGEGTIVKTGGGTCAFTNAYEFLASYPLANGWEADESKYFKRTAHKTLCNDGGFRVEAGTAIVYPTTITNDVAGELRYPFVVDDGATLSFGGMTAEMPLSFEGNGVVSNGGVSSDAVIKAGEGKGIEFDEFNLGGKVFVEWPKPAEGERPELNKVYNIAKFKSNAPHELSAWKSEIVDVYTLRFSIDGDGNVTGKVASKSGLTLIIR